MKRRSSWLIILFFLTPALIQAEDWPQWMGPGRNNVWTEQGLLDKFPAGGASVLWRTKVAGGYAGPAVAEGKVFVTDYVTAGNAKIANFERKESLGTERVLCLDEKTGDELWRHEYPVRYSISYPAGPRCTPNFDNGKLYTLGAEGHLICFDAGSGEVRWAKHLPAEYGTKAALWGYAGHPLIDSDKLICVAGGKGSHAVAFDKHTGDELWRTLTSPEQGYSPPTIIEAGGVRQLILLRPDAVSGVDPETGKEFWSLPYEATSGSIIMSPVRWKDYLYAAGYSNKNILVKLDENKPDADVEWQDLRKHGISPVNVQPMVVEDTLYGFDQNGRLYAVELPSGRRLWETSEPISKRAVGSGTAFIIKQADRFWLFSEKGELIICRLSPTGYEEIDRAKVIEPSNVAFGRDVVWSAPAFANRKAYIRNDEECICVDLEKEGV